MQNKQYKQISKINGCRAYSFEILTTLPSADMAHLHPYIWGNVVNIYNGGYTLYILSFQQFLEGLSIGLQANVIVGSYYGHVFNRLQEAFEKGDLATARKEQVGPPRTKPRYELNSSEAETRFLYCYMDHGAKLYWECVWKLCDLTKIADTWWILWIARQHVDDLIHFFPGSYCYTW